MRLATIVTPNGPRLHVRGRSGYVDVGEETGNPGFASLAAVLSAGTHAGTGALLGMPPKLPNNIRSQKAIAARYSL